MITGAGLGLAAGIAALVLPIAFLTLSAYNPGGWFSAGPALGRALAVMLLAGAILFVLSLLYYRRAFAVLRKVDPRFSTASALSVVGSMGFLILLLVVGALLGSSSALVDCARAPSAAVLSCVRSASPLGMYAGFLGFWLGWVGGLGVVLGLGHAGGRYRQAGFRGGAVLYAILLLALIAPFASLFLPVPGEAYLLFAIPALTILAPMVVIGSRPPAPPGRGDDRHGIRPISAGD
jgi:hypothetical protein